MDTMIQSYMEETEDMLQKAEECIIRLEIEDSSADINELFRIAHTIKGSSHMVGYEDIGNLMHRIEDMLDCTRNGSILFDQRIVSLCFEGFDIVKKMLRFKIEPCSFERMDENTLDSLRISENIAMFIKANKKEEEKLEVKQPELGIISTLLKKEPTGKNKYYITFFIEEDAPMISPVILMILRGIEDIGTLVYSSKTDEFFSGGATDTKSTAFEVIMSTDAQEAELYTYFALFYVEKINIINLTRTIHKENDYYFNEIDRTPFIILRVLKSLYDIVFRQPEEFKGKKEERATIESLQAEVTSAFASRKDKRNTERYLKEFSDLFNLIMKLYDGRLRPKEKLFMIGQEQMIKLMDHLYNEIKGKYIIRTYKAEKKEFIQNLNHFIEMIHKATTLIIFIDISRLNILHEIEIKDLIEIKRLLQDQMIEMIMITKGTSARKIMNIFDCIRPIEEFKVFPSEMDAILDIFRSKDSYERISVKAKELEY